MSELYRHLLIPKNPAFLPDLRKVVDFVDELELLEALPKEAQFIVVTDTGKTREIAKNSHSGEVLCGPDLAINRYPDREHAIISMHGAEINELWVQGKGPAAISPFVLYRAHCPDVPWTGPYVFTLRCRHRRKVTHVLHSGFNCECDIKSDDPAIFENPWNNQPIQTSGPASARFWIEFGIGDGLMPMIVGSLDILDSRLVASAINVFGVGWTQGCICNDD